MRLLLALLLACLIFAAATATIGLAAWAFVAIGLNDLVSPLIVMGLATACPLSIVAADRLVPGRVPGRGRTDGACPHCGSPILPGHPAKPAPTWDL